MMQRTLELSEFPGGNAAICAGVLKAVTAAMTGVNIAITALFDQVINRACCALGAAATGGAKHGAIQGLRSSSGSASLLHASSISVVLAVVP